MSYSAILEEIKMLTVEEHLALLEAVSKLIREELGNLTSAKDRLTASDIRRLPLEERQRILAESAQFAVADYEGNTDLTEFTQALAGDEVHEYEER